MLESCLLLVPVSFCYGSAEVRGQIQVNSPKFGKRQLMAYGDLNIDLSEKKCQSAFVVFFFLIFFNFSQCAPRNRDRKRDLESFKKLRRPSSVRKRNVEWQIRPLNSTAMGWNWNLNRCTSFTYRHRLRRLAAWAAAPAWVEDLWMMLLTGAVPHNAFHITPENRIVPSGRPGWNVCHPHGPVLPALGDGMRAL